MSSVLSFIIPVFNEEDCIVDALQRLASVRENGHEVVVVDGGSSDSTVELAKPCADKVIRTSRGRARQMNAGALAAGGDVFLFLHADTRLPDSVDHYLIRILENSTCQWGRFDIRLSGSRPVFRIIETTMNLRSRFSGIATGDQCIFLRKALFRQVNGFPELMLMEDVALSRKLKRVASPVCLSRKAVTSSRRWERHGIVRTILKMWFLRFAYSLGADPSRLAKLYYP